MGKLNINNLKVINSGSLCLPHPMETATQLIFKPDRNRGQANSDLISGSLRKDLTIFHQNIRGLKDKTDEIMNNIGTNPPHVLCFTEHHLESCQLDSVQLLNYTLVAKFCRTTYRNGGVCICMFARLNCVCQRVLLA